MRKDISEERALFSQALREGLARKFEAELAQCPGPIQCSEVHLRKMNEIIEGHARTARISRLKQRIIAAMVAVALLMLTACAAYAHRGKIKEIFVKMRETYICLVYDESEVMPNKSISQYYTLEYVPEGYVAEEDIQTSFVSRKRWSNSGGDYILLEQFVWDGTNSLLDSEMGESSIIKYGTIEIYYRITQLYTYIWNDGTYSFMLTVSQPLLNDELEMLLDGLTAVQ